MNDKTAPASSAKGRKVREVARAIREHIFARMDAGERLASERELARQHGCSLSTVRRALAALAADGWVERIHGSGTYVADPLPAAEPITSVFFYGSPLSLLVASYARDVLRGVLEATRGTAQKIQPTLGWTHRPASITSGDIDRLGLERCNSVICLEVFNHDLIERLAKRRITVSVDFACHRPGVSSCALDHRQNVQIALEQLWQMGHRRIGYAGRVERGATDPAHLQRLETYENWMRARHVSVPPEWKMPAKKASEIVLQAENWVRGRPCDRPTAVLCAHNVWPFAQAVTMMGVAIPGQLSLMSIDRPEAFKGLGGALSDPAEDADVSVHLIGRPTDVLDSQLAPLRSLVVNAVDLPFRAMGQWAMREVFRRLGQREAEPAFKLFTGTLSPGNTIAPPPAAGG